MLGPAALLSTYSGCERRVGVWAVNLGCHARTWSALMADRGMVPNASRRPPILLMVKRRLVWGVSVAARMP